MCDGIANEFDGIDLGDKRLNKRSALILEMLAANPEASVNAAIESWGDTLAAYRFFRNEHVSPDKILEPHRQATERRMREHPVILVVQDTTEFDFTAHPPEGAQCLNVEDRFGLYDHTHLAVTPEKLCLGVIGSEQFDHAPQTLGKGRARKHLPIEEKESLRWLTGYRLACQLKQRLGGPQIVSVADCEADIYEIFVEVQQQANPADFIIRARENRCTPQRDPQHPGRAFYKVQDELAEAPVRIRRTISLRQTPKRQARAAELEIRAVTLELKPPASRATLPTVRQQFVQVREVNGPGDGTDVCWLLMTSLPIETDEDLLRVIDYYVARWIVEVYFRTLKTGCRVERIQLETLDRVKNCLAFYKIIAWRIIYLTYLNRTMPTLPCTAVFDDCEWKSVWMVAKKKSLPATPPTLGEFVRILASLGGYNNRRSDPPPGPQVLWTATRRMLDFAIAWLNFGPGAAVVYK
jgi:Transposase DNA-binding/Transposase Tn5 dimerisation domain